MTCTCDQTRAAAATEPLDAPFPVPAYPPGTWFTDRPDWLTPDTKIAVDDEGRVAGYFYHAGQCLVHDAAACPKPSPTFYAAFHQQDVAIEDGSLVRVGVIGNVNGHADPYATIDTAQAHYADPSRQLMSVRAYDDEHGGYILGAMVPNVTYGDVALVRRSALSGDWRQMPAAWWNDHGIQGSVVRTCEGYDCIGPTLVTRPGLPLVRSFPRAAALGGLGGVQLDEQELGMAARTRSRNRTQIDVPGGITITTEQPDEFAEPGPHPVQASAAEDVLEARIAADAPGAPPEDDTSGDGDVEQLRADVAALQAAVSELQNVVGQLIDATTAPMAAAAELPPLEDDDPKA